MKLSRSKTKDLILFIVGEVDYDLVKDLDPETAEEPENAEEELESLIDAVQKYIKDEL